MKKILLSMLGAGLILTSCSSDEPFATGEGGEKQVTFTLNVPDAVGTRAGEQSSSDKGGVSNTNSALNYTIALYYGGELEWSAKAEGEGTSVTFNPTVILGRNYQVVAYADFKGTKDDLKAISIANGINDESKDAYFVSQPAQFTETDLTEDITLKRPFGKLRLVATDYKETKTAVKDVTVTYTNGAHLNQFNAFLGEFAQTVDESNVYTDEEYDVAYTESEGEKTIFVDYIPVNSDGMFPFEITVTYVNGTESFTRTFAQDIPVKRNALTTLKGNFFTANATINVTVVEDFDSDTEFPTQEGKIMLNGIVYDTISAALANAGNGDVIAVGAGEFEIPAAMYTSDKGTITFEGMGDASILKFIDRVSGDAGLNSYAEGASLIFKNLKVVSPNYTSYSGGFGRAAYVEFNNCTYVGQYRSHSNVKFVDCTIDPQTSYIYTDYGNADFERCVFNCSEGKGIQVYRDDRSTEYHYTINVKDCKFTAAKTGYTWDSKPVTAIDINSLGAKFTVNIDNPTVAGSFGTGMFSNSTLWNIKGGEANVIVNIDNDQVWPLIVAKVGDTTYSSLKEAFGAVTNNSIVEILRAGQYSTDEIVNAAGKTLTVKGGVDGVEILINQDNAVAIGTFDGSNVTFENLALTTKGGNYKGFARMEATYNNCVINNLYFTQYGKHKFTGCTFNAPNDEHCTWTYGASEVDFENCVFNYTDRCVNVYVDNAELNNKVSVDVDFTDCKFNFSDTRMSTSAGAVEINSSVFTLGATVDFAGCTAPESGEMVFISAWDPAQGANVTVTVDGTKINAPIQQK